MSTSKGSTAKPAAKTAAKAKPTKEQRDKIRAQIKKDAKLPGAVHSRKYAPASRRRTYVNKKKHNNREQKSHLNRRIKINVRKNYEAKVREALNKGAALPKPSSNFLKKVGARMEKRKVQSDDYRATKKARLETANAYVNSLGKDRKAAEKAWKKGGKIVDISKVEVKPKLSGKTAPKKWNWRSLIFKGVPQRTGRLSFAQVVSGLKNGKVLKTRLQERREEKIKRKAQSEADKKKNVKKPKKVSAKHAAAVAKKKAKWEKKLSEKKARVEKRKQDLKNGVKVKKTKAPKRTIKYKKFKPVSIKNLDRVHRPREKWWKGMRANLRASFKPGTVVIILKGKYAGRRAVFLKQLPKSGNLLVSGPFSINGVPLYRIAQSFVIATSTRLSMKTAPSSRSLTDKIFKKVKVSRKQSEDFFAEKKVEKVAPRLHRTRLQKRTDKYLEAKIAKVPLLKQYLQASFSLSDKDAPHLMRF